MDLLPQAVSLEVKLLVVGVSESGSGDAIVEGEGELGWGLGGR